MNRILLGVDEVAADGVATLGDHRAVHIREVLQARVGQELRIGQIDGPTGVGTILALVGGSVSLQCCFDAAPAPRSGMHLLLALPRPKVLKRLWAPLASFGLDRIFLCNAAKVERHYFDTHWLAPDHYRPLLLEGLQQAGLTRLPTVSVHRRFRPFVEDDLDVCLPGSRRLVAHPDPAGVRLAGLARGGGGPVLLAVGPEGGWDAFELDLLAARGFQRVSLTGGALRSDVACIALLAVLREGLGAHAPVG